MIRVRAHAKINLNLRVLDRRPDGYHDLHTVFQALALHDTLACVPTPGRFVIQSDAPGLPLDKANLAWRAADLLWRHLGRSDEPRDVLLRIEKRIPMKGGLGGGSSDAAAALVGLARLWDADVPATELAALGRQLGADVGFFFAGGAAVGTGRGDDLQVLPDLPRLGVLLVVPAFDVSTADAYRWIDETRASPIDQSPCDDPPGRGFSPGNSATHTRLIPRCPWPPPINEVRNDFEAVVAARHPELDAITRVLIDAGASVAAMTGSGSTVFGLFEDEAVVPGAANTLRSFGQVTVTHTLGRAEYLEAATPQEV